MIRQTLLLLLLLPACAPKVGATAWERMGPREKVLYVRSMIGHERVQERKGGNRLHYDLPPEEYVRRIDSAYSRGDRRSAVVMFEEMGTR